MYICICEQVTDKQIKNAIDDGATSMCDLRNELGIASQCGQCGSCAKALLKEHGRNNTYQIKPAKQISSARLAGSLPPFREATA